eukprot:1158255-Prorocentrum_minimum.AAC.2
MSSLVSCVNERHIVSNSTSVSPFGNRNESDVREVGAVRAAVSSSWHSPKRVIELPRTSVVRPVREAIARYPTRATHVSTRESSVSEVSEANTRNPSSFNSQPVRLRFVRLVSGPNVLASVAPPSSRGVVKPQFERSSVRREVRRAMVARSWIANPSDLRITLDPASGSKERLVRALREPKLRIRPRSSVLSSSVVNLKNLELK